MKWSLDLAISIALTVLIWTGFYLAFPSEPLKTMETVFILVVFYGLTKVIRSAWRRWGPAPKPDPK